MSNKLGVDYTIKANDCIGLLPSDQAGKPNIRRCSALRVARSVSPNTRTRVPMALAKKYARKPAAPTCASFQHVIGGHARHLSSTVNDPVCDVADEVRSSDAPEVPNEEPEGNGHQVVLLRPIRID